MTTKEKLRGLLGAGGVPGVSAEGAGTQSLDGIEGFVPPVSSGLSPASTTGAAPTTRSSWPCARAATGDRLLYVSLTDYVQHASAPGEELSDRYLAKLDELVGPYLDEGWHLGLVADHGMNAKPRIVYVGDLLDAAGVTERMWYCRSPTRTSSTMRRSVRPAGCMRGLKLARVRDVIAASAGVEEVLDREVAARLLDLPADRIGDLVVLADGRPLSEPARRPRPVPAPRTLRSHGGRHEQAMPILLSESPAAAPPDPFTNADIHAHVLGDAA